MELIPIQVQCYAGYKADESPCRFFLGDIWIEVQEILDRWYQGNRDSEWPIADYFKVLGVIEVSISSNTTENMMSVSW